MKSAHNLPDSHNHPAALYDCIHIPLQPDPTPRPPPPQSLVTNCFFMVEEVTLFLFFSFFTLYRIVSVFVKQIIRIKINLRFSRHPLIINIYRMRGIIIRSGIDIIRQIVIMRAIGIYIRIKYSVIAGIRIGFQCIFYSD